MGLIKMKALKVVALKTEKEKLSELLLELGALELRELTPEFLESSHLDKFFNQSTSPKTTYSNFNQVLEILDKEKIERAILQARKLLQLKTSAFQEKRTIDSEIVKEVLSPPKKYSIYEKVLRFLSLFEKIEQHQNALVKVRLEQEKYQHFSKYSDYVQTFKDSNIWSVKVGKHSGFEHYSQVLKKLTETEQLVFSQALNTPIKESLDKKTPALLEPAYSLFITLKENENGLLNWLHNQGVEVYAFGSKEEQQNLGHSLEIQEKDFLKQLKQFQEEQKELALSVQSFENLYDALLYEEKHQSFKDLMKESQYFCYLEAYIPAELQDTLPQLLKEQFSVHLIWEDLVRSEEYPIALKNHPLVEPYEVITEMFSFPHAQEIDPTPSLAPFYFVFFGMMFSDLAYGLILSALTGFMVFGLKVKGNMRKMCLMLFQCGFSAAFFGLLFGGFFGNMLDAITGIEGFLPPLWFNPTTNPMQLIILSVAMGFVHILTGLILKMKILIATARYGEAWLDQFPWILILGGLPLWAIQRTIWVQLPEWIPLAFMGLGVLLLLFFSGRPSKNPIVRLIKGLGALYSVTSYLSDLMSYTRILALCLATGVVAMVVNNIGVMGGFTLLGIVMFIVIAVLGHSLNFALSVLGAYIHSTRLQFVEFFGKFYEGGGKLFTPHTVQNQYTIYKSQVKLSPLKQKSTLKQRFSMFKTASKIDAKQETTKY